MVGIFGGNGLNKYRGTKRTVSDENSERVLNISIPQKCSSCGFYNYNIWGTVVDGRLRVGVRCMRCGKADNSLERIVAL